MTRIGSICSGYSGLDLGLQSIEKRADLAAGSHGQPAETGEDQP